MWPGAWREITVREDVWIATGVLTDAVRIIERPNEKHCRAHLSVRQRMGRRQD